MFEKRQRGLIDDIPHNNAHPVAILQKPINEPLHLAQVVLVD